jgi:serine/threonine protein kinase
MAAVNKIGDLQLFARINCTDVGCTFRGVDTKNQRLVLVKTFAIYSRANAESAPSRFEQEAAVYAQIDHPHVVKLLEYGATDDSQYLVLEFVEGLNLRALMREGGGALPAEVALAIFCSLLEGVDEIHRRGFIHRDLKPENILIGNDGGVKICDFDLAIREDSPRQDGAISGSPGYMSPEAILGEKITPASDIFSLGILFYELLTGARPFQAGSASGEMNAIVKLPPVLLSTINPQAPPLLDELFAGLLAKAPPQRLSGAREAIAWLDDHFVLGAPESRRQLVQKYISAPQTYQPLGLPVKARVEKATSPRPTTRLTPARRWQRSLVLAGLALAVLTSLMWRMNRADSSMDEELLSSHVPSDSNRQALSQIGAIKEQSELPNFRDKRNDEQSAVMATAASSSDDSLHAMNARARVPAIRPFTIHSNPWAYLFVDGDSIGMTPLENAVLLSEGQHELRFKNPKLPPVTFVAMIDTAAAAVLTFSLWEKVAQLEMHITPWAEIFMNGERRELPTSEGTMILAPGKYSLRFVHPQLGEKHEVVFLRAGETRKVLINMF